MANSRKIIKLLLILNVMKINGLINWDDTSLFCDGYNKMDTDSILDYNILESQFKRTTINDDKILKIYVDGSAKINYDGFINTGIGIYYKINKNAARGIDIKIDSNTCTSECSEINGIYYAMEDIIEKNELINYNDFKEMWIFSDSQNGVIILNNKINNVYHNKMDVQQKIKDVKETFKHAFEKILLKKRNIDPDNKIKIFWIKRDLNDNADYFSKKGRESLQLRDNICSNENKKGYN